MMNLEVRKWGTEDDVWPDRRVSIADKDSGKALFISARYADLSESVKQAEEIAAGMNTNYALKKSEAICEAIEYALAKCDARDNYRWDLLCHLIEEYADRLEATKP
jgi:hypothetical protein